MTAPHRAAVLGSPIAHSLSPALHRAGYAALGMDGWSYDRYEIDEAGLEAFVTGLDAAWAGLSLTMPLKRAILPLLDTVSDGAQAVGAVNTVVFGPDGRRHGDNTDVPGLLNALRERGVERVESAAVLGAGATASSALAALGQICDGEVTVYVRSAERAAEMRELGEKLGVAVGVADWADGVRALAGPLTVSTTPAGATDAFAAQLTGTPGVLFDVLYHPWPTALAGACLERGGTVLGGLDLLVHQAVLQFERFTGVERGPLAEMRAAGEAALAS
ncbi:shikimate dehydrogenase [Kitasatospora cheerisanensis]|uniref:Shikimate dehydrogenase n=1 Tax=Kitasatospora cheerisanensis KCTC 2395 TaxID=1348663 RepID=A0A066Z9E5_9ACTN|nr:shikimate dehydrogenase [Kitasatospora cheerisanensis]KDN86941.1 shikimate dehydrogenase [Kitasatospora cheerisanensis KCTC 2395]